MKKFLAFTLLLALPLFSESSLEKAAEEIEKAGEKTPPPAPEAQAPKKKPDHVNPKNYDDLEGEEGLYWGDWDGSIEGRVIDKQMNPIPFAKVKVHSKNLETIADKDGNFSIEGLQVGGHYSLIISARGKEPGVARWIPIPVRRVAKIGDFSIEPEKIWTNFWVVVTNTLIATEFDAASNAFEKVTLNCVSNYYDIVEGETNIYSYSEWFFQYHLTYTERRVLYSLGITNVPLAKKELARRAIGFGEDGRPLEPEEQEEEVEIEVTKDNSEEPKKE